LAHAAPVPTLAELMEKTGIKPYARQDDTTGVVIVKGAGDRTHVIVVRLLRDRETLAVLCETNRAPVETVNKHPQAWRDAAKANAGPWLAHVAYREEEVEGRREGVFYVMCGVREEQHIRSELLGSMIRDVAALSEEVAPQIHKALHTD
jgi:hypothetical protein